MKTTLLLLGLAALTWGMDRMRARTSRCNLDGVAVRADFRVRVVQRNGSERTFCGVRCAEQWLDRSRATVRSITLVDCVSGREIAADRAWFLDTMVGLDEDVPDYVRVFATREEAERHARAYGGTILAGDRRPFANVRREEARRD